MKRSILILLGLLGCTEETVVESDVLTVEICPAGTPSCDAVADGTSLLPVDVCVPEAVKVRAADLKANLQLSAGAWEVPTDPTKPSLLEVPLSVNRCARAWFKTTTTVATVRVYAELAGFTSHDDVNLLPAELDEGSIEIVPLPGKLAANVDIGLAVTVRAKKNGTPSVGTKVAFSVTEAEPEGTGGFFFPDQTVLSGTSASTKLSLSGAPTSLTIKVTATPPDNPDGQVEKTLKLVSAPP
jgi:hypothetical protein